MLQSWLCDSINKIMLQSLVCEVYKSLCSIQYEAGCQNQFSAGLTEFGVRVQYITTRPQLLPQCVQTNITNT